MSHRIEKIEDLIRSELSRIIQQEMRDPRVGLATVSRVQLTNDLAHAKIAVSVLGDDETTREQTVATLASARGFLRSQLARVLRIRTVPELTFSLDRGAEHSQRISDLLESLHVEPQGPGSPDRQDP